MEEHKIDYDAPYLCLSALEDGSVEIEAFNFEGKTCDQATAFLKEDLLGETLSREDKPEYSELKKGGLTAKNKGKIQL